MNQNGPITKLWNESRKLIQEKNLEKAEEKLDMGIMYLAQHTLNGIGDKDLIEGVKNETWKERFWIATETHIWPTRENYETEWKC